MEKSNTVTITEEYRNAITQKYTATYTVKKQNESIINISAQVHHVTSKELVVMADANTGHLSINVVRALDYAEVKTINDALITDIAGLYEQ